MIKNTHMDDNALERERERESVRKIFFDFESSFLFTRSRYLPSLHFSYLSMIDVK